MFKGPLSIREGLICEIKMPRVLVSLDKIEIGIEMTLLIPIGKYKVYIYIYIYKI